MAMAKLTMGGVVNQWHMFRHGFKRKIRTLATGNQPPGMAFEQGKSIPTIQAIKAFSERHSLSGLLPYESQDPETGLYFNTDSLGFMLYAFPAASMGSHQLGIINDIFAQQHELDAKVQITLIGSPEC